MWKDDLNKMKAETLFSLPKGLEVTSIEMTDDELTICAVSTQQSACCPLCSSPATRVHSHYTRTIADLPCAGHHVRLLVRVRKFFCEVSTCVRKIFAERMAPFVEPRARVTTRLYQSVQSIGFATGGMLGARLTGRLGIQTCPIAILRRMMALPTEPVEQVVELGIDDFDRFHLYKNLVEAVELILARCRAEIRKNAQSAIREEPHEEAPKPLLFEYAEVIALNAQGLGFTEITGRVGLSRRTIERWIKAGDFPEAKRRRKRWSVFDPYAAYVLSRWEQGCTNGLQLCQEIQAQGYQGSAQTIYRYLRSLRKKRRVIWKPEVPHAPLQDFSAHEAVWLFARDPDSLDEKEQETLTAICQASETARTTYQLVQEFRHLLHHREGEKLDTWLAKCTASQIRELQSFVKAGRAGQSSRCRGSDSFTEQWPGGSAK